MIDPTESELKDLEAELSALRPAPLPPALRLRVAAALEVPRRIPRSFWGTGWATLGAAAAVAAVIGSFHLVHRPARLKPSEFQPVSAEEVVTAVRDDGDVVLGDGTQARQLDTAVVQTVVWKDPASAATLSWSAPQEEIRIVPVNYQ